MNPVLADRIKSLSQAALAAEKERLILMAIADSKPVQWRAPNGTWVDAVMTPALLEGHLNWLVEWRVKPIPISLADVWICSYANKQSLGYAHATREGAENASPYRKALAHYKLVEEFLP